MTEEQRLIHIPGVSAIPSSAAATVHHVFIIDASGSMGVIRDSTISGFNEQVDNIRKLEQENTGQRNLVTLVFFDSRANVRYFDSSSSSLQKLTRDDYPTAGGTRFYATVIEVINRLRQELGDRATTERAIFTIITDGEDNVPEQGKRQGDLKELSQQVQRDNKWIVTFLGANIDVERTAQELAIPLGNVVAYTTSHASAGRAFAAMSNSRDRVMRSLADDPDSINVASYYSASNQTTDLRDGIVQTDNAAGALLDGHVEWDELTQSFRKTRSTPPTP